MFWSKKRRTKLLKVKMSWYMFFMIYISLFFFWVRSWEVFVHSRCNTVLKHWLEYISQYWNIGSKYIATVLIDVRFANCSANAGKWLMYYESLNICYPLYWWMSYFHGQVGYWNYSSYRNDKVWLLTRYMY